MKTNLFNINGRIRVCAFCKFWYDPTNSAIRPKNPRMGHWEYDYEAKNVCTKTNQTHLGGKMACSDYECKIPR